MSIDDDFMNIMNLDSADEYLLKSQERYRFLAEHVADIAWTIDREFRTTYVSPSIEKVLGFTPEERLIQPLNEMVTPESLRKIITEFQKEYAREQIEGIDPDRSVTIEVEYYHKNGSRVWMENNVKAIRDPEGRLIGLYGVSRDISERKQAEKERIQMERQLQQMQKAESLGRMAGAVAHHFNNLLGAVLGNLELALDHLPQDSASRSNINNAMECTHRAANLSRLMLTYIGHSIGKREPVNLSNICEDALTLLSASLPKKIALKTGPSNNGPVVFADATQIKQVVTNLVMNSCEAVEDGEGEIVVTIGTKPASELKGRRLIPADWRPKMETYGCISVSDNSGGMTPQTMERIFDPFFSTKFTGRGLGLPITLGVVKAHDGAIAVENRLGQGAAFEVFLPTISPEQARSGELLHYAEAPSRPVGVILLVEDEEAVREMAIAFLNSLGHEVISASDGVEAVSVYSQHQRDIQCVVLDLNMPRMDGWETLYALRKIRADLPVVLTSGYEESQVMSANRQEKPQTFLHKPYRRGDLQAALARAMRNPALSL